MIEKLCRKIQIVRNRCEMKKNNKKSTKNQVFLKILKIAAMLLTLCISCAMPVLSGAGLIYNRESYGIELERVGIFLILSGVFMTIGAVLCFFRKNIANISAIIFSSGGFILCMAMLSKLAAHADKSGWSDKYTMSPISDMYRSRLIPCVIPVALVIIAAVIQLLVYEPDKDGSERRNHENEKAPSVLGADD